MTFTPDIGLGTTIAFHTSWFAKVIDINLTGEKREAINITNMSSTAEEYIASRLVDAGELDVTVLYDQDKTPPISSAAETVTITLPLPSGKTSAGTIAATGFMIENSIAIPVKDKMTQSLKIKFTGARTYTASS